MCSKKGDNRAVVSGDDIPIAELKIDLFYNFTVQI